MVVKLFDAKMIHVEFATTHSLMNIKFCLQMEKHGKVDAEVKTSLYDPSTEIWSSVVQVVRRETVIVISKEGDSHTPSHYNDDEPLESFEG